MKATNQNSKSAKTLSLREIFEFVTHRWYWFLLSVCVIVGGMWLHLERQQPTYQRQSTILVKDDKATRGDAMVFTFVGQESGDMKNKIHILTSSELMNMVVSKLRLDVSYTAPLTFRSQDLYRKSPVKVSFFNKYAGVVDLKIVPVNIQKYNLTMNNETRACNYNDTVNIGKEKLVVSATKQMTTDSYGKPVFVKRVSPEMATMAYKGSVFASSIEGSTLINLTCSSTSIQKSDDILAALLDAYNEYSERDQRRIADNTAKFLEERIAAVSGELEDMSNSTPAGLKSAIATLEVGGRSSLLTDAGKGREEAFQLETSMSMAKYIQNYLQNGTMKGNTIPSLGGMDDMGIGDQVNSYNAMVIQYGRLLDNSGPNNSVVLKLEKTMEATRMSILNSLNAYIHALQIRLQQARRQERIAQSRLTDDQGAYDIYRHKEIKKSLHSLLLKKQEENALNMINTDTAAKLVEPPYTSAAPYPSYSKNLAMALLVGLLLPIGVWWILVSLDTKVRNRQDIEDATSLHIIGEIPEYESKKENGKEPIAIQRNGNDPISESFRVLCTHLGFALKGQKVVMLTSTTSGEGKSFVSSNLAASLAMSGKKVILVDLDICKKEKSGLLDVKDRKGVTDYLKGEEDLQTLIIPAEEEYMPDVLPAGRISSNRIKLLSGERLDEMIATLRENYDCVVIDSVPAMGLADSLIINRVAELTVYVIRERMLDRRFLPELEKMYQEDRFKNMHVILNNCQFYKNSYYGYYSYSKYYGYGYAYGDYGNEPVNNKKKTYIK